jgi:hypothetical protein
VVAKEVAEAIYAHFHGQESNLVQITTVTTETESETKIVL